MTTKAKNKKLKTIVDNDNLEADVIVDDSQTDAVDTDEVDDEGDDFSWDDLMDVANATETREDIIKRCIADKKHFMFKRGLHVKNVIASVYLAKETNRKTTRLTFVIKEAIPSMVKDTEHTDAFGMPTSKIGISSNVFTSAYAVGGAMKETAKGAIWARKVSTMTAPMVAGMPEVQLEENVVNDLYAGGTIDVLIQRVPAGAEYRNPFASEEKPAVFAEDRIFHHVVVLTFGEVGNDMYVARLNK